MRVPLPAAFLKAPLAHRGLHDRSRGIIENSTGAFRAAIAAGYGIEMDLQLSQDGIAMVFHDDRLDRLTNATGPVAARTAAELGRLALTGGVDTIPTLSEVLALVAGRVPLLIELKDQTHVLAETDARLEAATVAALAGYPGPVALMSFNPHAVVQLARLAPRIPRGLTTEGYDPAVWPGVPAATCDRLRAIPDYDRAAASFISHDVQDLDRPRVTELKAAGAAILCWTVRSPEMEDGARRVVDNITFEGYAAPIPA